MISDVIMPGLDGPHLLKAARPLLGDAPVMFISGYAEAEFSKVLEGEPGVSFLAKPIDITVLMSRRRRQPGGSGRSIVHIRALPAKPMEINPNHERHRTSA